MEMQAQEKVRSQNSKLGYLIPTLKNRLKTFLISQFRWKILVSSNTLLMKQILRTCLKREIFGKWKNWLKEQAFLLGLFIRIPTMGSKIATSYLLANIYLVHLYLQRIPGLAILMKSIYLRRQQCLKEFRWFISELGSMNLLTLLMRMTGQNACCTWLSTLMKWKFRFKEDRMICSKLLDPVIKLMNRCHHLHR